MSTGAIIPDSGAVEDASPVLRCPSCRSELKIRGSTDRLEDRCPVCHSQISLVVFSRLYGVPEETPAPGLADHADARCVFYPELSATIACDECGCFLSEKAAVRWGNLDLCLPCLHRLREEKQGSSFVANAKLYDNQALALVTVFAPFTLFTAPVALFLLLRHRKTGKSFEPRSPVRWWTALVLAAAWLVAWTVLLVAWTSLVLDDLS